MSGAGDGLGHLIWTGDGTCFAWVVAFALWTWPLAGNGIHPLQVVALGMWLWPWLLRNMWCAGCVSGQQELARPA